MNEKFDDFDLQIQSDELGEVFYDWYAELNEEIDPFV